MPSDDDRDELRAEIRRLEVRIMALRREKEDLALIARKKPWWFRLLRATAVVLRVVLRVAAVVGALVVLIFLALLLSWRPR